MNMMRMRAGIVLLVLWVFAATGARAAGLQLDSCFGDNMVLQRDVKTRISGTADEGSEITVEFSGQKKTVKAVGTNGVWRVVLDPLKACCEPQMMLITSSIGNQKSEIKNILIGDVWVCSGQSNMRMSVMKGPWCGYGGVLNATNEVAAAHHPGIRLYQNTGATNWVPCTPDSVKMFSAAGYFFARELHSRLKVPIGIAEGSMGATDAESWAPREALFDASEIQAAEKVYLELKPMADVDRKAGGDWKRAYDKAKKEGQPLPAQPKSKMSREDGKRYGEASLVYNAGNNYRSFIARYTPMAIKGAIWYQGESNRPRADRYAALMTRLIASWRKAWGQDFPFIVMQLVNFGKGPGGPQTEFADLREAQQKIADTVPNTGLAIGIDIGVPNEIHPPNKQEAGRRLGLVALKQAYGQDLVATGPKLTDAKFESGKVALSFDPGGEDQKLVLKNSATNGFELAGVDGKFIPAVAELKGNTITLAAPDVKEPVAVRYAWYDDPPVSLFNSAGLPAAPFCRNKE
jgi:sialate O-acetylesterase